MEHTLIAVFENEGAAQHACNDLVAAGFPRSDIQINAAQQQNMPGASSSSMATTHEQESIGDKIKEFFHELFTGDDSTRADLYSETVQQGGYVLTLSAADEERVDRANDILERHNPVDMEEREAAWKSGSQTAGAMTGSTADTPPATGISRSAASAQTMTAQSNQAGSEATQRGTRTAGSEEQVIPVVEEQLQVGKRKVQRAGVRVVQRVSQRPVQESVQLHDERVTIERRPVDQAASADAGGLQERTVEVRETVEEPVVAKTARVVEEVVIGKEQRDRTETVQDTVRRTDIDVEQLGAQAESAGSDSTTDDAAFRSHWQSSYAQAGGRYEDYAPAYRYGSTLGADSRYRGQRWEAIEPQVRADWEATHAGSPWEKTKEAVRTGWEKMTR